MSTTSPSTTAAPDGRVHAIVDALHAKYSEADLGNLADPVEELVYISLTRQTHRQNASRSWRAIEEAGGASALLDLSEEQLVDLLRPAGFSRQKAQWIKRSLEIIQERMGSLSLAATATWSDEEAEQFLRSLPGISIKSAKCIMLYSMGRRVLPVDTHVRRVATRFGLVPEGLSERAIHDQLEELVDPDDRYPFHVNSIWHGRGTCTALRPRCEECVLRRLCDLGTSRSREAVIAAQPRGAR